MSANANTPTREELQAYALGRLGAARVQEVAEYVEAHPECWAEVEAAPDDRVSASLRGAKVVPAPPRRSLLELAIEAVVPVVAGCAGALAAGLGAGFVGQVAEKAINHFGGRIVERWLDWLRRQAPAEQAAALVELADVSPEAARSRAAAVLERFAPEASPQDREAAATYLGAIPRAARQSILSDRAGVRTMAATVSADDSASLLRLLPACLPPYDAPCDLSGTKFHLEELVGTGGFGAVYRATNAEVQNLQFAIKFCLDRSLLAVLQRERDNLERLKAEGQWSPRVVRLFGFNLEHETPFLVYEYVAGGDLVAWLERCREKPTPAEVLALIVQVAEALAFAHERGIVHRDLKPANVLIEAATGEVKLADFGIGGVAHPAASRTGLLSAAEQASLFRGAGTPLYMDPEQRDGGRPDPRHDLHSLGVMWYQLLAGDVRREMPRGWERELERKHGVPAEHRALIARCVGWIDERPKDAGELLKVLPAQRGQRPAQVSVVPSPAPAPATTAPVGRSEAEAWAETKQANTVEAYELFLAEWPSGQHQDVARMVIADRLRDRLVHDLTNTDLRRRYLASRTPGQQESDSSWLSDEFLEFGSFVYFFLLVGCGYVLAEPLKGLMTGWPEWAWAVVIVSLILLGLTVWGIGSFFLTAFVRKVTYDPISEELGPLPPDTPRDSEAARRYLLGEDRPA